MSNDEQPDLPIRPCYVKNPECGTQFHCGTLCDTDDPKLCAEDPSKFEDACHGNNPEFCNGILSCCTQTPEFNCDEQFNYSASGARNTQLQSLGCDIVDDNINQNNNNTTDQCTNPNAAKCMEYQNTLDQNADCSKICWTGGGHEYIKNVCENKIGNDKFMCKAMEYFCEWDDQEGCTLSSTAEITGQTPRERWGSKYNAPVMVFPVRKDCTGLSECIEIDDPTYRDNLILYSAQSAWNSKKQTSYDPDTRIHCVEDTDAGTKTCITLPRCQFVLNPCDCGSIPVQTKNNCTDFFRNSLDPECTEDEYTYTDQIFLCANHQFNNTDNETNTRGSGYCTWCKGIQTDQEYRIPEYRADELEALGIGILPITRDPIEWEQDLGCTSRCTNYSECESPNSEELWNACIYANSNGEVGIDPSILDPLGEDEKRTLLREQGFCFDPSIPEHARLIDECETELAYLGSINWGRVFSPNGGETAACQYRYNWVHNCILAQGNSPQIAENYACTWCPSVQCKIGKIEEICSEVVRGDNSWNGLPYCDTKEGYGEIVNANAPPNCDCFLPKTDYAEKPNDVLGPILAISGASLLSIGVIVFVM